jgi:hypothetical protein
MPCQRRQHIAVAQRISSPEIRICLANTEATMTLEEITLALFTTCNSLRIVAYVPQVLKAAADRNGAPSISLTTWFLFLIAHLSTVAYALINRSDWGFGSLLRRQRHLLPCHPADHMLEAPRPRPAFA